MTFLDWKAVACRASATLGGREEMEKLVWMNWQWRMLSAGTRYVIKLLLDMASLVIPWGKRKTRLDDIFPGQGRGDLTL